MLKTLTLWIWYLVVVIAIWVLLLAPGLLGLPLLSALMCSLLFALIVSIILLPYYDSANLSDEDTKSIEVFVVTALLLPVMALIVVFVTGEYKVFWSLERDTRGKKFMLKA